MVNNINRENNNCLSQFKIKEDIINWMTTVYNNCRPKNPKEDLHLNDETMESLRERLIASGINEIDLDSNYKYEKLLTIFENSIVPETKDKQNRFLKIFTKKLKMNISKAKKQLLFNKKQDPRETKNFWITDENVRVQIAKSSVVKYPIFTTYKIQQFNISDEGTISEILKTTNEYENDNIDHFVNNRGDLSTKIHLPPKKMSKLLLSFFNRYGRKSSDKKSISKLIIGNTNEPISSKIDSNPENGGFSAFIHHANIKNEETRINLAKHEASYNATGLSFYIKNYDIQDESARLEIAKIAARKSPRGTALFLKNYEIEDENDRYEIAKIIASAGLDDFLYALKHCDISEHKKIFELMKIAAKFETTDFAKFLKELNLDQEKLIEIAKVRATSQKVNLASEIQSYGIEEEAERLQIAKIAAIHQKDKFLKNIHNFELTEHESMIEVIMIAAKEFGGEIFKDLRKVKNISDDEILEIVKVAAEYHPYSTAKNLRKCGIKCENSLAEIVSIIFKNYPHHKETLYYFFGISDNKLLFDLTKVAAEHPHLPAFRYVEYYELELNNEQRLELAEIAAKHNGYFPMDIQNFVKLDNKTTFDWLKINASFNGRTLTTHFPDNRFNLNPDQCLTLAKIAATNAGVLVIGCIWKYGTFDLNTLLEIAEVAVHSDPSKIEEIRKAIHKEITRQQNIDPSKENALNLRASPPVHSNNNNVSDGGKYALASKQLALANIIKNESFEEQAPYEQLITLVSIVTNHFSGDISTVENLIQALIQYRDPYMRTLITTLIPTQLFSENSEVDTEALFEILKTLPHKDRSNRHRSIANMLFFTIAGKSAKKNLNILNSLLISNKTVKDAKWIKSIINGLYALSTCDDLSDSEKMKLLEIIGSVKVNNKQKKPIIESNLKILSTLIRLGYTNELKSVKSIKDIDSILKNQFTNNFDVSSVENFSEKYLETFDQFRNLNAIFHYRSSFLELPEDQIMLMQKAFDEYICGILEGTFKKDRYNLKRNQHLATLFKNENDPLLIEWMKGDSIKTFLSSGRMNDEKISFLKYFGQKIMDNHLGNNWKENYPHIQNVFCENAHIDQEIESIKQIENYKDDEKLLLEIKLLELCQIANTPITPSIKRSLNELKGLLKELELSNDIDALLRFGNNANTGLGVTVVDTDDPEDLLLCGTEIGGSCQRVNGNPEYNKGLIGYLLNGQTRLIAVKDRKGEIIGRCLLRLLWDKKNMKPVLFRERLYTNNHRSDVDRLINEMCKKRSNDMGLELVYNLKAGQIVSYGGPAPFEYVDGCGGIRINGMF